MAETKHPTVAPWRCTCPDQRLHLMTCWKFRMPVTPSTDILDTESPGPEGKGDIGPPPSKVAIGETALSWWNPEEGYFPEEWWSNCLLPNVINRFYKDGRAVALERVGLDPQARFSYDEAIGSGRVMPLSGKGGDGDRVETGSEMAERDPLGVLGPRYPYSYDVALAAALDAMRKFALLVKGGGFRKGFDATKVKDGLSECEAHRARAFGSVLQNFWPALAWRRDQAWLAGLGERKAVAAAAEVALNKMGGHTSHGHQVAETHADDDVSSFMYGMSPEDAMEALQSEDEAEAFRDFMRSRSQRGRKGFTREGERAALDFITSFFGLLDDRHKLAFVCMYGDPKDGRWSHPGGWDKPRKTIRETREVYKSLGHVQRRVESDRKELLDVFKSLFEGFNTRSGTWERCARIGRAEGAVRLTLVRRYGPRPNPRILDEAAYLCMLADA